jgi:hypothetical protein
MISSLVNGGIGSTPSICANEFSVANWTRLLADKTADPTGKSTPGFIQLSEALNGLASASRN